MKTFGSKLIDELWQSMGWTYTVLCTQQDHVASISIIYLKIYEQLFNKFTNVLYIKTPNKNIFISLSLSLSFQRKEGRDWNGVKQSLRRSYQRWLNHKIRAPSSNSFGIIPISLGLVSIRVSIYCEEGKLQTGKFVNVKGEGVVVKWKAGEVKKLFIYLFY